MSGRRTSVNKINEIKRMLDLKLSDRTIARALRVSRNTIASVRAGEISTQAAIKTLKPKEDWQSLVDWKKIHAEHQSGVTLLVLWEELKEAKILSITYSSYYHHIYYIIYIYFLI